MVESYKFKSLCILNGISEHRGSWRLPPAAICVTGSLKSRYLVIPWKYMRYSGRDGSARRLVLLIRATGHFMHMYPRPLATCRSIRKQPPSTPRLCSTKSVVLHATTLLVIIYRIILVSLLITHTISTKLNLSIIIEKFIVTRKRRANGNNIIKH